jgi:uncharacterized protein (UPF0335 family)
LRTCFSVGGKIKSTTVLKSRLAKKHKEKDSYEEYEDNKYKAMNINENLSAQELISIYLNFAKKSSNSNEFIKKIFKYYNNTTPREQKIMNSFFMGNDNTKISVNAVRKYFSIAKEKVGQEPKEKEMKLDDLKEFKDDLMIYLRGKKKSKTIQPRYTVPKKSKPVKAKKTIAKKKPTQKTTSAIPSEIYYQKTADGKCILYLTKAWYNKMYPQYQKQIKEYFKWNPYDKFWKCKKKGAESILQKMEIPERNSSPLRTVTPEKVKPTKKSFSLSTQSRSIGQGNQQQLGLSFVSRLERLEKNEKSIANVIIAMKPKIDKIEEDVEIIKQIVEVEHHNKGLQGDVF